MEEYILEARDKDGNFLRQVAIFPSKRLAKRYMKANQVPEFIYSLIKVTYDEFNIEQSVKRIF